MKHIYPPRTYPTRRAAHPVAHALERIASALERIAAAEERGVNAITKNERRERT